MGTAGTLDTYDPASGAPGDGVRKLQLAGQMFRSEYGMRGEFCESCAQFGQCERRVQRRDTSARRHNCEKTYYKFDIIVRDECDRVAAAQS